MKLPHYLINAPEEATLLRDPFQRAGNKPQSESQ